MDKQREWNDPAELLERAQALLKPSPGMWALDANEDAHYGWGSDPAGRAAEATACLLLRDALLDIPKGKRP